VVLWTCDTFPQLSTLKRFIHTNFVHYSRFTQYLLLPSHLETYAPFVIRSPWQHCRNSLLLICKDCSAVTARPRFDFPPAFNFSVFCEIILASHGPGLLGHLYRTKSVYLFMSLFFILPQGLNTGGGGECSRLLVYARLSLD
jgi:hypothetical protein